MKPHFVDVWQAELQVTTATLRHLSAQVADFEKAKAESFKTAILRDRYLAVRGFLRQTLAAYLDVDPRSLVFELGQYGKPALAGHTLYFNLSHSADTLLIAVANFADIGVDIESSRQRDNLDGLAKRCFSDREYQSWQNMSANEQGQTFYRLWTKKEAFVKAVGRGIGLGISACEFELGKDGQLLAIPLECGAADAWKVQELDCGADFSAALVTPNCPYQLRHLLLPAA